MPKKMMCAGAVGGPFCVCRRSASQPLKKQNISLKNDIGVNGKKAGNIAESFSVVDCWCLAVGSGKGRDRAKEKGAAGGHALWVTAGYCAPGYFLPFCASLATSTSAFRLLLAAVPISSMLASAARASVNWLASLSAPFSCSWRRAISPRAAVTRKPAVLSPGCFAVSMSAITSWGTLTVTNCDFAFLFAEAICITPFALCISLYAKKKHRKALTCVSLIIKVKHRLSTGRTQQDHRYDKARQWGNTDRASNHNSNHRGKLWLLKILTWNAARFTPGFSWRPMTMRMICQPFCASRPTRRQKPAQFSPVNGTLPLPPKSARHALSITAGWTIADPAFGRCWAVMPPKQCRGAMAMRINFYDRGATAKISLKYSILTAWRVEKALDRVAMQHRVSVGRFGVIFRTAVVSGGSVPMLRAYKILTAEVRRD